jgi:hypothetical protein
MAARSAPVLAAAGVEVIKTVRVDPPMGAPAVAVEAGVEVEKTASPG